MSPRGDEWFSALKIKPTASRGAVKNPATLKLRSLCVFSAPVPNFCALFLWNPHSKKIWYCSMCEHYFYAIQEPPRINRTRKPAVWRVTGLNNTNGASCRRLHSPVHRMCWCWQCVWNSVKIGQNFDLVVWGWVIFSTETKINRESWRSKWDAHAKPKLILRCFGN